MPQEDRRIIFAYDEVYKALYALCTLREVKKPPPGIIRALEEDPADDSRIFVSLENPQDNSSARVEFSRDFLAAALMLFCRGCGIPLPKGGRKSVLLSQDHAILRVQI